MTYWSCVAIILVFVFYTENIIASVANSEDAENNGECHHDVCKTEQECEEGWFAFQNSCYQLSSAVKNVRQAGAYCDDRKSSLFHADSMAEFISIVGMTNPPQYVFTDFKNGSLAEDKVWKELKSNGWGLRFDLGGRDPYYREIAICFAVNASPNADDKELIHVPCTYKFKFYCERNSTLPYTD